MNLPWQSRPPRARHAAVSQTIFPSRGERKYVLAVDREQQVNSCLDAGDRTVDPIHRELGRLFGTTGMSRTAGVLICHWAINRCRRSTEECHVPQRRDLNKAGKPARATLRTRELMCIDALNRMSSCAALRRSIKPRGEASAMTKITLTWLPGIIAARQPPRSPRKLESIRYPARGATSNEGNAEIWRQKNRKERASSLLSD